MICDVCCFVWVLLVDMFVCSVLVVRCLLLLEFVACCVFFDGASVLVVVCCVMGVVCGSLCIVCCVLFVCLRVACCLLCFGF